MLTGRRLEEDIIESVWSSCCIPTMGLTLAGGGRHTGATSSLQVRLGNRETLAVEGRGRSPCLCLRRGAQAASAVVDIFPLVS